jgi:molybdopterin-guanine dinucleotide biosynthesis protein A
LASDAPVRPRSHRLEVDAWGIVFCGGASRRMGRDKARLVLEGTTLLERAVRVLAEVTPRVLLASGSGPRYPELGLECLADEQEGAGPLAGLAAALERVGREGVRYACILACDMPRVSPGVFTALLACARASDADVCLVRTPAGLEPLCGVYHARSLPAPRAALASGARRMDSFHGAVRLVTLDERELGSDCARNLNTPEEFRAAGGRLP